MIVTDGEFLKKRLAFVAVRLLLIEKDQMIRFKRQI